jgi:predicted nucleic acid-binding protein
MARARSDLSAGTVLLDSEGLSKWCAADRRVTAIVREAQSNDFRVVVSAMTPIEAFDIRAKHDRLRWHLSRLRVEAVTEEISLHALELLRASGLHGRKYAIDAVVAATALRSTKPVMVLTSDEDDMLKLCGKAVRVVSV